MRALVTGASGFVGPHLIDHLEAAGDDVVGLGLGRGPDLRDHRAWRTVVTEAAPHVIYHLAGWSDVGGSWHEPLETFDINVMGTISILEAARRSAPEPVLIVLVSSADVYGTVDRQHLPLTEDHPVRPHSPYGASKLGAEAAGRAYSDGYGVPVIIARPFNHMGPGQSDRFAAPSWAAQIAAVERGSRRADPRTAAPDDPTGSTGTGRPQPRGRQAPASATTSLPHVVCHGDLSPRRDITDVRDVVRAYRLLAERGRPGETYNICSGKAVAMQEVFDTLIGLGSVEISGAVDPDLLRPVDLPVLLGSYERLRAATGWTPRFDLAETLAAVLDDARNRATGNDRPEPPVPAGPDSDW